MLHTCSMCFVLNYESQKCWNVSNIRNGISIKEISYKPCILLSYIMGTNLYSNDHSIEVNKCLKKGLVNYAKVYLCKYNTIHTTVWCAKKEI